MKSENVSSTSKSPVYIRLTEDDLPEIKKWKIGKKYELELEAELMSMSKGSEFEDSKSPKMSATFKVTSIEYDNGEKDTESASPVVSAMRKRL